MISIGPGAGIALWSLLGLGVTIGSLPGSVGPAPSEFHGEREVFQETPVQDPATPPEKPGRRRAIGGIASVFSRSTLEFPQAPDQAFECEATFVFPDRARWRIALAKAKAPGTPERSHEESRRSRSIRYRFGSSLWLLNYGRMDSQSLVEEQGTELLMQLELRRVAMIWPAELEWATKGEQQVATLPDLGTVHATLDPKSGRPTRLESHNPDGSLRERLDGIEWRKDSDRYWPSKWDLVVGGQVIWHETFLEVKSGERLLESHFIPPDQRSGTGGTTGSNQPGGVQKLELKPMVYWTQELSPEVRKDWKLSLQAGRAALARWEKELEGTAFELDPRPTFKLDVAGRPLSLELRLRGQAETTPEGWKKRAVQPALRLVGAGLDTLKPVTLATLRAALPQGSRPASPTATLQLTPGGVGIAQVVLPYSSGQ